MDGIGNGQKSVTSSLEVHSPNFSAGKKCGANAKFELSKDVLPRNEKNF